MKKLFVYTLIQTLGITFFLNANYSKILNPTKTIANDSDIIGAYRVLANRPISFNEFLSCKALNDHNHWHLSDLARYLFSLPFIHRSLGISTIQSPHYSIVKPLYKKNKISRLKKFFNARNSKHLSKNDYIAAYRVLTGNIVTNQILSGLQVYKAKSPFNWIAKIILSTYDECMANLHAPSLDTIEDFPIKLKNGLTIFGYKSDYVVSGHIKQTRQWEPHLEWLMKKIIKQGDYVIDIGANIGYFTMTLAKLVGPQGKVFSFEPIIPLIKNLKKGVDFNNLTNVEIHACALSNQKGKAYLKVNIFNPGISKFPIAETAHKLNLMWPGSVIEVPTYTLDNVISASKVEKINYIKIDVEGAEDLVFAGGENLIKQFKPLITWEFNLVPYRNKGINPLKLLQEFQSLGYKFAIITDLARDAHSLQNISKYTLTPKQLIKRLDQKNLLQADIFLYTPQHKIS